MKIAKVVPIYKSVDLVQISGNIIGKYVFLVDPGINVDKIIIQNHLRFKVFRDLTSPVRFVELINDGEY